MRILRTKTGYTDTYGKAIRHKDIVRITGEDKQYIVKTLKNHWGLGYFIENVKNEKDYKILHDVINSDDSQIEIVI